MVALKKIIFEGKKHSKYMKPQGYHVIKVCNFDCRLKWGNSIYLIQFCTLELSVTLSIDLKNLKF